MYLFGNTGNGIVHCTIELQKGVDLSISSGTDLNNLKTTTKKFKDKADASDKYYAEIYKKLDEGFIYKNPSPSGVPHELMYLLKEPNKSATHIFDIHPNGKQLVMGSKIKGTKGAEIHLADLETGILSRLFSVDGDGMNIHSLHFTAAGDKVLFLLETELKILDLKTKKTTVLARYKAYKNGPHPHFAPPMFNLARNRCIYFAANAVKVCDDQWQTIFELTLTYSGTKKQCKLACISPTGKFLALHHVHPNITDTQATGHIDIWEIDKNELVSSIETGDLNIEKIKFNPQESEIVLSKYAASGPGFFDIKTGKLIRWFKNNYTKGKWGNCWDFAYSPDGRLFANGHYLLDSKFEKYHLPDFELNHGNDKPWKVMFSADSKYYIEGGSEGRILIRQAGPMDAGTPFDGVQMADAKGIGD